MKSTLLALSLLALCALTQAQEKSFYVHPSATDAGYSAAQDSHYVHLNKATAINKLLVFFPGTGAQAKHYQLITYTAVSLGYHCINIAYPNAEAAASCASQQESDCYTKFRQEVCYGTPGSEQIDVDTLNSIYTRLVKTLEYLNTAYPNDGWGQFLTNGKPSWSKIALGGHSQGSGHALFLSKANSADRVLMFGGPQDYNYFGSYTAPWIGATGVTDTSRLYSFLHIQDEISPYPIQYKALTAMGLLAGDDSTIIDNVTSPYSSSHCLYTNETPNNAGITGAYHNSVAVDFYTPGIITNPTFSPVWRYMLSNIDNTSIQENTANSPLIYPNPSKGSINIQGKPLQNIRVVNELGMLITENLTDESGFARINLDQKSAGIYFIQIGNSVKKILIQP